MIRVFGLLSLLLVSSIINVHAVDFKIGNDDDVDHSITFDGDTSDGTINYDEDNADFEFNQDLIVTGGIDANGVIDFGSATSLEIPNAADVSGHTGEGYISWDADDDKLYVGDGAAVVEIAGGAGGGDEWGDAVDADIIPDTDDTYDLGDGTHEFTDLYIDGTIYADAITMGISEAITLNGMTLKGTAAYIESGDDFVPSADSTYNLGGASNFWANAYIDKIYFAGSYTMEYDTAGIKTNYGFGVFDTTPALAYGFYDNSTQTDKNIYASIRAEPYSDPTSGSRSIAGVDGYVWSKDNAYTNTGYGLRFSPALAVANAEFQGDAIGAQITGHYSQWNSGHVINDDSMGLLVYTSASWNNNDWTIGDDMLGIHVAGYSLSGTGTPQVTGDEFALKVYKPIYGSSNYQVYLEGTGAGTGVWFGDASHRAYSDGTDFYLTGLTDASATPLEYNTSTKKITYDSSARKYKENIRDYTDDFKKVLKLQPKTYIRKNNYQKEIGYIADDLHEMGLSELVGYKDNEPDFLNRKAIQLYMLEVIKNHETRIKRLEVLCGILFLLLFFVGCLYVSHVRHRHH